jgi:CRP-like cAMP-binding protein
MPVFEIFRGLSKSETARIFDLGLIRPIEEGAVLFHKGDIGHEMYVLLTGRMEIFDEGESGATHIAEFGPGELFGEMAMFESSHERSAGAVAVEHSQVLILSEEILNKFIEKKAPRRFLSNTIGVLCHRLRLTNNVYMRSIYGDKIANEVEQLSRA